MHQSHPQTEHRLLLPTVSPVCSIEVLYPLGSIVNSMAYYKPSAIAYRVRVNHLHQPIVHYENSVRLEKDGLVEFVKTIEAGLHNTPQILLVEEPCLLGSSAYFVVQGDTGVLIDQIKLVGARAEIGSDSALHIDQIEKVLLRRAVFAIAIFIQSLPILLLIHEADLFEEEALLRQTVLEYGALLTLRLYSVVSEQLGEILFIVGGSLSHILNFNGANTIFYIYHHFLPKISTTCSITFLPFFLRTFYQGAMAISVFPLTWSIQVGSFFAGLSQGKSYCSIITRRGFSTYFQGFLSSEGYSSYLMVMDLALSRQSTFMVSFYLTYCFVLFSCFYLSYCYYYYICSNTLPPLGVGLLT